MRQAILASAVAMLFLAACTTTEPVGEVAGTVGGGVIGSEFGPREGGAEAPIGSLAGGLIGAELGRSLDAADRQRALQAEYEALEYGRQGQPIAWQGPASRGEVIVGPTYAVNRLDCREYTHTVHIDGRPRVARGTACRRPDGVWRVIG